MNPEVPASNIKDLWRDQRTEVVSLSIREVDARALRLQASLKVKGWLCFGFLAVLGLLDSVARPSDVPADWRFWLVVSARFALISAFLLIPGVRFGLNGWSRPLIGLNLQPQATSGLEFYRNVLLTQRSFLRENSGQEKVIVAFLCGLPFVGGLLAATKAPHFVFVAVPYGILFVIWNVVSRSQKAAEIHVIDRELAVVDASRREQAV